MIRVKVGNIHTTANNSSDSPCGQMEKEEKDRQNQLNKLMGDMKVSQGSEVPLQTNEGSLDK